MQIQYHMGEDQWENVEIAMNMQRVRGQLRIGRRVYVEDLTAPRAHVDARVPDTGNVNVCARAVSQMH